MTFALNFEEEAISSLQLDYAKLFIKPQQLKVINDISNSVCEQIEIPVLAMRATTWKALKDWQIKYNKPISDIVNMKPSDKIIAAKQIFNLGKDCLKCILSHPKKDSEIIVDIAFEKAFKLYIKHISNTAS